MGKNNRHKKHLKSEKSKVKLKSKNLPKGQNITDTNFKVKKIVIKDQLKQHDQDEILSRRKLNVKDLLTRLQHHNSTVRQDATKELKEILLQYPEEIISSHLNALLRGIGALTLDKEKHIRQDGLKVLDFILKTISDDQLEPFSDIPILFLCCAMTHINPNIKEDSLHFLDVLVLNCAELVAKKSKKILPHFLDLISEHHSQSQVTRQLSVTLNSKNTSIKWRNKVLERLSSIFNAIIDEAKLRKLNNKSMQTHRIINVDDRTFEIPLYNSNNLAPCLINFNKNKDGNCSRSDYLEADEFNNHVEILMPLILESWLEARPNEKQSSERTPLISYETADFLRSITKNIQLILEFIDIVEPLPDKISKNICDKFQNNVVKYLLNNFPYSQTNSVEQNMKRPDDFEVIEAHSNCVEQNLALCYIYMWMISVHPVRKFNENVKNIVRRILQFTAESLNHWRYNETLSKQMIKLLKLVLLKCTKILYKNGIDLGELLPAVIKISLMQSKKEFGLQLFNVLGDIISNSNLTELHNEPVFKEFIETLPDLLLEHKIHDNTLRIINRVVLRYWNWVCSKFTVKRAEILENAKTIEIIDSENEKESRLMICNLFYFIDKDIYY